MRIWLQTVLATSAVFFALAISSSPVAAQDNTAPSLADQLAAQYKLARVGGYGPTRAIIDPGTILTVQKGGILGIEPVNLGECPAKYQNSVLKPPKSFCATMAKNFRNFEIGEKVYPTKINVVTKDEKITIKVVACDTCNGTNPPTYYKSQVDFIFPAGFLEKGDVSKVEDTVGEVFSLDDASAAPQAPPPAAAAEEPATPQPAPAPTAPVTVKLGETIDQVVAALGQPGKKFDLGSKQVYVYKDLKVTFLDGKVTDVE
jgi:hypothetical protein